MAGIMIQLSQTQNKIVEAPLIEAIQVLASAGSGKTRVLTERVRFILEHTKKEGVIALTFTNKAAEEMQNRLSDCGEAEDRVWVATIHSIAQRILEQYGHTIGLPKELHIYERDKDRMEVFIQSLRDDGIDIDKYLDIGDKKEQKNREKILQKYMEGFSLIKRELLLEDDIEEKFPDNPRIWKIYQDYQTALLNSGGIDYDDILVYAHKLLLNQEWIANIYRAKYKHLCVDEAQDLNTVQYEFIKAFCGDDIKSVMFVGDPHQMIYGFNGSSSKYLCEYFVGDFSATQHELKENYRSTKQIIKVANKLKPHSQEEHEYALEGVFHIQTLTNELEEANWIMDSIKSFIELGHHEEIEGDISFEHMVVIARNRFVFSCLEEVLAEIEIPYSLRKGERKPEPASFFGKILDYSIRIKLNPKDWVDGKKLCSLLGLNPPENWSNTNILEKWSQEVASSNLMFPVLYADFIRAINQLDSDEPNIRKFVASFRKKLSEQAETDVDNGDDRKLELERSIEELDDFAASWTKFKQKGLGDSLQSFRNALALGQLTEDVQPNGLTLSTVHTMKGLEKDIVFVMTMCEGVFPDYRANTRKEIDEERNNAFVAVTRAKRWLYLTYPKQRTMPWGDMKFQTESRFIREING
jgi:DNA helicase-2/ATP-dependent DNA helicase PcrA